MNSLIDIGAHILARAASSRSESRIKVCGATSDLTVAELGAMMAKIDPLSLSMARYMFMDDKAAVGEMTRRAYVFATNLAAQEKWRLPKGKELLRQMVGMALIEIIHPEKCEDCKGTCQEWDHERKAPKDCGTCGGTGSRRYGAQERARKVGVALPEWKRRWSLKYDRLIVYLQRKVEHVAIAVATAYLDRGGELPVEIGRPFGHMNGPRLGLEGMARKPTRVYFIQAGERGPVKVGVAADCESRLKALQTGNPNKLKLIGQCACADPFQMEKQIHAHLRDHRLEGEWFKPSAATMALVEASEDGEERLALFAKLMPRKD